MKDKTEKVVENRENKRIELGVEVKELLGRVSDECLGLVKKSKAWDLLQINVLE